MELIVCYVDAIRIFAFQAIVDVILDRAKLRDVFWADPPRGAGSEFARQDALYPEDVANIIARQFSNNKAAARLEPQKPLTSENEQGFPDWRDADIEGFGDALG
ncbi:MAG: hypothetical protein WCP26_04360, partial [Actinomycetes bacterium]